MSVLITGIDMPSFGEGNELIVRVLPNGAVLDKHGIYLNAKAVPVPPHGRLIDADALYREIKAECNPYGKPSIGYDDGLKVLGIIGSTPPVIPADGKDIDVPSKDGGQEEAPAGTYDLLYEEGGPDTR